MKTGGNTLPLTSHEIGGVENLEIKICGFLSPLQCGKPTKLNF